MATPVSNKSLKEAAMDFLRLASSGNVREAYELYVDQNFKHRNRYFKGDRESLMKGMEDSSRSTPNKEFKMLHALEDGNCCRSFTCTAGVFRNPHFSGAHFSFRKK